MKKNEIKQNLKKSKLKAVQSEILQKICATLDWIYFDYSNDIDSIYDWKRFMFKRIRHGAPSPINRHQTANNEDKIISKSIANVNNKWSFTGDGGRWTRRQPNEKWRNDDASNIKAEYACDQLSLEKMCSVQMLSYNCYTHTLGIEAIEASELSGHNSECALVYAIRDLCELFNEMMIWMQLLSPNEDTNWRNWIALYECESSTSNLRESQRAIWIDFTLSCLNFRWHTTITTLHKKIITHKMMMWCVVLARLLLTVRPPVSIVLLKWSLLC